MMGLRGGVGICTICLTVLSQYRNVSARQTDGRNRLWTYDETELYVIGL